MAGIDGLTNGRIGASTNEVSFANGEEFITSIKVNIINKLVQLQRKHEEIEIFDRLIKSYGHKNSTLFNFKHTCLVHCIIRMCIHSWGLHKISTTEAINRVVKILRHLKSQENNKIYETLNNLLWESELPFKTGGEYSRLLIYYPPQHIERLTSEEIMDIFQKTEGIYLNDKDLEERIALIRDDKKSWSELSENEIKYINIAVEEMLLRNKAIFIMLFFQLHGSMRLRYSRECERITSSVYFRYLQYKSQVMFNNASDDQRTRLAHTLEVSGVAKTIAMQLGCNWELVEAISLGHDLGHAPFGHQGEEALDEILHKTWAGRFSHSLQSVNVLGRLAHHTTIYEQFGVSGLCLSRPVMEGILKHDTDNLLHDIRRASWRLQYNGWREILIRDDDVKIEINGIVKVTNEPEWNIGLAIGGLESQIVYWSDKIAYAGHDWEEFAISGLIEQMAQNIQHILQRMHQLRHLAHGRDGVSKDEISIVKSEIDIIRLIRFHIDRIRRGLNSADNNRNINSNEQCIFDTFKPSQEVVMYDPKNDTCSLESIKSCNESPLARFVHELIYCMEKYINNPNRGWLLKFFTIDEYELILDFFTITHDLIYITEAYPKQYNKNNDVLGIISLYLTETDNRRVVQALQTKLIKYSRYRMGNELTEEDVLESGRQAIFNDSVFATSPLPDSFPSVRSLNEARIEFSKIGYIEEKNSPYRKDKRELKRWFKENLQKQMHIRLDDCAINVHNRIAFFVHKYYIGSERVRIMKHKSHKIVQKLFEFFMEHEDMLPQNYKHRIAFDAQKISLCEDEFFVTDEKRLLVIQYLIERIQELYQLSSAVDINKILESIPRTVPKSILTDIIRLPKITENDNNVYSDIRKTLDISEKYKQYFELCVHIAKARVIADYISTMTDRYAEKKYNEIVSSSTSWMCIIP